jgi:FdhE protein
MCGNTPTLSEIQGKEGERRLRCGWCGAGWYYPRLRCAFCRTDGHKTLGYLAVEGEEEKYRLQTCDVCRGYLKVVVTFDPIPVELLPVEDLATLHLDSIARERGFTHSPLLSAGSPGLIAADTL